MLSPSYLVRATPDWHAPFLHITHMPSRASSTGSAADTMTNFAMLVDAEIEQVRKAGTAQDLDDDGVLDWSELRKAVLKLSGNVVRARRHPHAPPDFSNLISPSQLAQFVAGAPAPPPAPKASAGPGAEHGGPSGASVEPLQVYATVSQTSQEDISAALATPTPKSPSAGLRRLRSGAHFDAEFNTKTKKALDTWGFLPTFALLKPQNVRKLKHLDRWVRMFMPPAFIIYCVCMYSTVHHWDSSVNAPLSAVESCV